MPYDFEISSTFMQIKRFFASLVPHKKHAGQVDPTPTNGEPPVEEHERIVSIENLSLSDPQIKNREIVMTAKFTALTYRLEEKATPAAKSTKPAPAAPAAPAGAGSAAAPAKPLPPAATPAGAKARVEDSMKKDDQRGDGGAMRLKGGLMMHSAS